VCRPLLGRLEELAGRQWEALAVASGIGPGGPVDRFSLGAATLSLLAAAAEEAPVLVLLDDVQWLDAASVDALVFAARRLGAEQVAMLVAAREDDGGGFDRGRFETLALAGIDREAAAALLAARAGGKVARGWRSGFGARPAAVRWRSWRSLGC
jgi:hypothetical protein